MSMQSNFINTDGTGMHVCTKCGQRTDSTTAIHTCPAFTSSVSNYTSPRTLEYIRKQKKELAQNMNKLLNDFESKTGVTVIGVEIEGRYMYVDTNYQKFVRYAIEIELEDI